MLLATVLHVDLATVQDSGRRGLADVGVPTSGAWHRPRHLDAVRLALGADDVMAPAIELLGGRLVLRGSAEATLAVVGPARVALNDVPVPTDTTLQVRSDDVLEVAHRGPGPVYATLSGWDPARLLGSAATDTFSGLIPTDLHAGTTLHGTSTPGAGAGSFLRPDPQRGVRRPLRILATYGTNSATSPAWLAGPWTTVATSRSGTRLVGGPVPQVGSMPSSPVVVGAIQATPSGELIILGPDGALTGGYPILGVVCSADIPRVSELIEGESASFELIGLAQAVEAFREQESGTIIVRPDHVGQEGSIAGG